MFVGTVPGIARAMHGDITKPYITMVTGPPGSLKTGFCLTTISNYLRQSGEFGLYCTVEETAESLMAGARSMGISLPPNLQITDYPELRRSGNDAMDYLKFTKKIVEHFKRERGDQFTVFILDSLGAIYSLTKTDEVMRKKMFHFFDYLRSEGLYSFVITERNIGTYAELQGNEGFLADAILAMGLDRRNGKLVRTLQIEKMRHVRHAMEKQAMDVGASGVVMLGPLFD